MPIQSFEKCIILFAPTVSFENLHDAIYKFVSFLKSSYNFKSWAENFHLASWNQKWKINHLTMSEMLRRWTAKLQRKLSPNSRFYQVHHFLGSLVAEKPDFHRGGKLTLSEVLQLGRKDIFSLKFSY